MLQHGLGNKELVYNSTDHNGTFVLDDSSLELGADMYVNFVLENINGINLF